MASNPPADLILTPLEGPERTLRQMLTTFHLAFVALDPFTNQSAWILKTAARILTTFQEADVRVAWVVTADASDTRAFLGPWATEILTFVDPKREVVKGCGLEHLPAMVHVGMDGTLQYVAEGWRPTEWGALCDNLARITRWKAPTLPAPNDPGPFEGTHALG